MNRPQNLLAVFLLTLVATVPLASQATFEIPSGPTVDTSIFRPETLPEEVEEEETPKLVYEGEPLVLPPECRAEAFLRAGLVCSEHDPCDMYLELVEITSVGDNVLIIGNIHTPSATVASVLLRSADGGKTWEEPTGRVDAASLEMIQFEEKNGWVGGQQTTQDHSSSPFLLVTSDSGAHWVRRPIWAGDEDRYGAVIEIYFAEPRHGYVIVDRLTPDGDTYELYESMNGGLSWMIREVSEEMPAIRRRVTTEKQKLWRLRDNRGTAAYEIEQLVDGAWTRVAAFASDLGPCETVEAEKPFHVGREP